MVVVLGGAWVPVVFAIQPMHKQSGKARLKVLERVKELSVAWECGGGRVGAALRRWKHMPSNIRMLALHELIQQQNWQIALKIYRLTSVPNIDLQLHAHMVALLEKLQQQQEVKLLREQFEANLSIHERVKLGCRLIEIYGNYGLWNNAVEHFEEIQALGLDFAKLVSFRSLLKAQASAGLHYDAEETLKQMQVNGCKLSLNDYKVVLHCYGKCGLVNDVQRIFDRIQMEKILIDTTVCNMVLESYGLCHDYMKMKQMLESMENANVSLSVRSLNALVNACPALISFALSSNAQKSPHYETLLQNLYEFISSKEELELVESILSINFIVETVSWSMSSWRLDLHGMSLAAAYLTLVLWLRDSREKLHGRIEVPEEFEIVIGQGKHRDRKDESPVRNIVLSSLRTMESPFTVDRQNKGRLLGRGHAVKKWLTRILYLYHCKDGSV